MSLSMHSQFKWPLLTFEPLNFKYIARAPNNTKAYLWGRIVNILKKELFSAFSLHTREGEAIIEIVLVHLFRKRLAAA